MTPRALPSDLAKRLARPIALTRAGMAAERLVHSFWPLVTLLMAAAAALIGGVAGALAPVWLQIVAGFWFAAACIALALGFRSFRWPRRAEALARLDAQLTTGPIAALMDDQAIGRSDPSSRVVWETHRARMMARLDGLQPVPPEFSLAPRDPYALRLIAALALTLALGFGTPGRIADMGAVLPGSGPAAAAIAGASWEGWIEPPAYTGRPSLYLNDQPPGPLAVPAGSRLTLRLYGKLGDLMVAETVSGAPSPDPNQPSWVFEVAQSGVLTISGSGGAEWQITAIADAPPTIRLEGEMSRILSGEFRQRFLATDDYGVHTGQARITLDLEGLDRRFGLVSEPEPRDPIEVDLPMPWRGDRTFVEEEWIENFAQHPWAGLPVLVSLGAQDASGQEARTGAQALVLPARRFLDPLAMALIELRRDLLWNRENSRRVAQVLRAVSHRGDDLFDSASAYLQLRHAIRALEAWLAAGPTGAQRDEIARVLWDIAVLIEDGNLADALARLRRAEERLAEAIRQGADEDEISELMQELREAMRDYLNQLAQQEPGESGQNQAGNENAMQITPEDLQAMMDRIEELLREGRTEEAMAMLDMLREMMENLEVAEGRPGEGQNPGEEAMQGLRDTLRDQQGLSDEAFRDLQEQLNPSARAGERSGNVGRDGGLGQGQSHTGEGGEGQGEGAEGDLAERQQALRERLEEQRRGLPGAGTPEGDAAREALDQAGRAMGEAAEALDNGETAEALDRQAEAMEALREGMRNLDEAMAQAQRQQGQQGATAGQPGERQSDPLGRNPSGSGAAGTEAPLEGGEDVYRRAKELMEELRRRSGDGGRPEVELDYLKRLLERF
jgi:uncharacterized protein (TIGR02302 family)